jgi:DNA-binding Lrp family transcriptional regulator
MATIEPIAGRCAQLPQDVRQNADQLLEYSAARAMLAAMPKDLPPLDRTDRAILEALSEDARMPNNRLAERVGVAPSTCLARVRALRRAGVLQGFHAEIDLAALGRPLQAMVAVRLTVHAREQIDAFTDAVRRLPGVLSIFHMTGVNDYLVWVAAADAQDLREFVVDHLATHPAVAHAETSLIYEHKRGPGIWGHADPAP